MRSPEQSADDAHDDRQGLIEAFVSSGTRTLRRPDQLDELVEAHQFTREQVARALGCSVSTVYSRRAKMKTGAASERGTGVDDRLDDLHYLVTDLASRGVDEEMVRAWTFSRSAHLRGRSPASLIASGHADLAAAAAEAFVKGWSPRRFDAERPEVGEQLAGLARQRSVRPGPSRAPPATPKTAIV